MGLAASQGRYLCLTARMSDLVYEGQQISQQRMALAKETSAIAQEYNDALSNTVMQAAIIGQDGQVQNQKLTYNVITSKDPFAGLGMRIVDANGYVVVPDKVASLNVSYTDEDGKEINESYKSATAFMKAHMPDLEQEDFDRMSSWSLEKIALEFQTRNPDSTKSISTTNNSLAGEGEHYLYDENCLDPEYLHRMISSGEWMIQQEDPQADNGWSDFEWQGSSRVTEVLDTTDDAAAEAKYEAAMQEIQKKDKILELRLEQVKTEESAIETEIESIKQVISKNIEDSFGTFA